MQEKTEDVLSKGEAIREPRLVFGTTAVIQGLACDWVGAKQPSLGTVEPTMGPSYILTSLLSPAAGWGSVGYTLGHNHRTQFHPLSPVVKVKGPLCPQKCPPQRGQ